MRKYRIAFEASPLLSAQRSGIGCYAAGLTEALMRLHPESEYRMVNVPRLYRRISSVLPVPYDWAVENWADITHFFNYIVPFGVCGKTVVTVHDMVLHAHPETMRDRTRTLLWLRLNGSMRRADRIVTDSVFSKQEIAKYYPAYAHKVDVVPCGVDTKRFHPVANRVQIDRIKEKLGIAGDYFLYVGTLEPRKNLVRLIQAYEILCHRHNDMPKLVLAGGKGWQYDAVFAAAARFCEKGQIRFVDYVPAPFLAALYAGAAAFVFPSLYEGFGLPPLEAMACGTPVIVSNAASLPEVVGDAALQIDPGSAEEIAKAMQTILDDTGMRQQMRQRGLARAEMFTWDAAAERLYAVYSRMEGVGE